MTRTHKILLRLSLAMLLLPAFAANAQQTPFYTENWSGSPFPWNNVSANGYYYLANSTLYNNGYDDITQPTQLMYTGSLPYGWDYSIQTLLSCHVPGQSFIHYLRGGNYTVQANVYDWAGDLSVEIFSGANYIGGVATSCGTMTSTISGSLLTVAMNGTTVFSTNDSTYAQGGPGVGTINCWYNGGIQTTVLAANPPTPPNPPTNLAASPVYAWQVNLSWSPTTGTIAATGYNVYRKNPGGTTFNNIGSVTSYYCSSSCRLNDPGVDPDLSYTYQVTAYGANGLESSPSSPLVITTAKPSFSAPDTGGPVEYAATWGAGPEKIALLTGALAIHLPLVSLKQQSRGAGLGVAASWNSQLWSAAVPALDTGYGLNWVFQIGAVYPVFSGSTLVRYEFQDGAGVIHKLFQVGSGTQFKSTDSTYLLWDYAARTLSRRDGSVWSFGCASLDPEPDAGTLYPTQLEDTNGNRITIQYQAATGLSQSNSSSRITSIQDSTTTYTWSYTTINGQPHVHTVSHAGSQDAIFTYTTATGATGLSSPFGGGQPQTAVLLTQISFTGAVGPFVFSYNSNSDGTNSGEINQIGFPYRGYFRYAYGTVNFSGGRQAREITARYMSADGTQPNQQTYTFSHPNESPSQAAHSYTAIQDPSGNQKVWSFIYGSTNGWDAGLSNEMLTCQGTGTCTTTTALRTLNTTWTQDIFTSQTIANPRVCATTTILQDQQTQTTVEQDTDSNGNVTAVREYSAGVRSGNSAPVSSQCTSSGAGNPAGAIYRTTTTQYQYAPAYTSRNILNLPAVVTVCAGLAGCANPVLSQTTYYDQGYTVNVSNMPQHDPSYGSYFAPRGNPYQVVANGVTTTMSYDIGGNVLTTTDSMGHTVASAIYLNTGQVQNVASGGNSATATYNSDLTTNSVTGSNSDTISWGYASYRPTSANTPDGYTTYTYVDPDPNHPEYPNNSTHPVYREASSPLGKKTRTYYDGFGRAVRTAVLEKTSPTNVWISTVTQYNACSCSATGKAVSTSRPYHSDVNGAATDSNGGTANPEMIYWTTTTSDGLGRPVSVVLTDNNQVVYSQTSYGYTMGTDTLNTVATPGSLTTITDTMGKQKDYFYDGFGRLMRVDEPNASNVLGETARYGYDIMGRLIQVQMSPQGSSPTVTFKQTRTFVYNTLGQLTSSTTPEKGAVTYTYQADGLLSTKQSGNGTLTYAYDSNHRLLSVTGGGKTTAFTYDTDPNSQLTAQNAWGRMTTASNDGYTWHFSYDNMGRVNQQTLQTPNAWTHATYAYDPDGRLATVGYPGDLASSISGMQAVNPCQYSYTILGRATGYQCWGPDGQQWLGLAHDATYNAAGQILGWSETSFTWNGSNAYWNYPYNLSRTYDPARGWITDMGESGWYPSSMSLHYNYQANGQLASEVNSSSGGSVTTSYTYDNLNRLATAGTGTWNMTFAYDEFGNRTSQTGSGGAPVSVLTYDSGTNRINSAGYSYDGAGNLTAMPLPQGASMGLTYDVFDRLVEADTHPANGQTTTSTMAYDAFGRRIAKTSLGAVYFYDASGRQLTSYLGTFVNGVYYYFAGQRLYNWTDRQGSLKGFYGTTSYYPYGEDVGTSTGNDNYKFAQTYRDSDSGLDYANSRYYASGIGRFLTGDSFDASASTNSPQSWNRYAYVQNDPVNFYDPSGRLWPMWVRVETIGCRMRLFGVLAATATGDIGQS